MVLMIEMKNQREEAQEAQQGGHGGYQGMKNSYPASGQSIQGETTKYVNENA